MLANKKRLKCNHAYIDGANLHRGTAKLGWRIDYQKFYTWLVEKHHIKRACIFMGYIPANDNLYMKMWKAGFLVRFKDTIADSSGSIKGNCDADMVLRSVRDVYESVFDKSVIVSSDGDFSCLVEFLQEKGRMSSILSPNDKCSVLLMRTQTPLTYLNDVRELIGLT